MKIADIRQKFIDFFVSQGHQWVASSSLVPHNDPTLLFTNAGMNQFKNMFLGLEAPPAKRIVTVQKCVRAGGKHNDLENVGYTTRHHTFFEMLGNFSFGDYFKQDAINFAWTFLISPQWLNLPAERLLVTVYATDEETYHIWHNVIGLPSDKIIRIGDNQGTPYASDNFWQMGDMGPCGPCTEIFYDHGDTVSGEPPGNANEGGDRFTEIWNCVFMQFNRDASGTLQPLPHPSVDTGMGLERIATVMQGVHSNYATDLFQTLIASAAQAVGIPLSQDEPSLQVIADHIRACAFLIADDVLPANDGRGYVLRRIIRRAVRHGYKLNQKKPFLHTMVADLVSAMGNAYPQLHDQKTLIQETLYQEESRFAETLERGMALLDEAIHQGTTTKILPGNTAFLLYDTFGFPIDLTADICKEQGISIDKKGFALSMQKQRQQSQQTAQFKSNAVMAFNGVDTSFEGYEQSSVNTSIVALYRNEQSVNQLLAGESGVIVLNHTPFYAESGGQVGDSGNIAHLDNPTIIFKVIDTQKIKTTVFGHIGTLMKGAFHVGDAVKATIDKNRRDTIARNHSAAHLLHAALRQALGTQVSQKGSCITADQIRFDFSQLTPLSVETLNQIEKTVNDAIRVNDEITVNTMAYNDAIRSGTMALFNEKYGDQVRVLTMGDFSRELCGGTHAKRTGDIGLFKIISEHGISAGVRRIEAITAETAVTKGQEQAQLLNELSSSLKAHNPTEVIEKLSALQHKLKSTEKRLIQTQEKWAYAISGQLAQEASDMDGIMVLTHAFDDEEVDTLRKIMDQLKQKLHQAVIVLAGSNHDNTLCIIAGVTNNLTDRFHAGRLVGYIAEQLGGKGGGKADIGQGSAKKPPAWQKTLESTMNWLKQQP